MPHRAAALNGVQLRRRYWCDYAQRAVLDAVLRRGFVLERHNTAVTCARVPRLFRRKVESGVTRCSEVSTHAPAYPTHSCALTVCS